MIFCAKTHTVKARAADDLVGSVGTADYGRFDESRVGDLRGVVHYCYCLICKVGYRRQISHPTLLFYRNK
jgi:hypothetical protein